tara:strand:+ start:1141 stop:1716 length:576 start_codon:yes stop_codon:yes gene_type:complete
MIGILGFQGSFWEHKAILDKLNFPNLIIKKKEDLKKIDALIIPGGESTVIRKFINNEMKIELNKFINIDKKLTLGTCAGIIVLSNQINNENEIIGGLNIKVNRNHYGGHAKSFIKDTYLLPLKSNKKQIYIRAPYIEKIFSDVKIISNQDNIITGVKQNNIIGLTYHPELSNDIKFYQYFISLIDKKSERS